LRFVKILLSTTFPTLTVCICISLEAVDVESLDSLGLRVKVLCAKQRRAIDGKMMTRSSACCTGSMMRIFIGAVIDQTPESRFSDRNGDDKRKRRDDEYNLNFKLPLYQRKGAPRP